MQEQTVNQGKQPPKPSSVDQMIEYAKKAKGTYDDVNNLYNLGVSAGEQIGVPTYNAATQAAWNSGAGEASQAVWNAGADTASGVGTSSSTAATEAVPGTNYAGWTAAALSAYNSGKALTDKNTSDEDKAYEGAMAGPRAVGAFYTLGLSNLGEGFARKQWGGTMKKLDKFNKNNPMSPVFVPMQASRLWTSDKWKTEGNKLKQLQEKGINIPEFLQGAMKQTRGRRKEELVNPYLPKDFVGDTPQYGWTNNKFATSRNANDLTGKDIWGYSAFFDKFGNDWLGKLSPQQREAIANKALERKAVNEHHGTIDINWNPELDAEVNTIVGNKIPKAPQAQTQQQPATRPPAPLTPNANPQAQPTPQQSNRKGMLNKFRN